MVLDFENDKATGKKDKVAECRDALNINILKYENKLDGWNLNLNSIQDLTSKWSHLSAFGILSETLSQYSTSVKVAQCMHLKLLFIMSHLTYNKIIFITSL
ncbi:hypothetical protein ACKWTF_005320 [Chironomus riparius]